MNITEGKGWTARLELGYALRQERTALISNRHIGPLVVQRPLYPEGGVCHTSILHPPGGVVGGDHLEIDVQTNEGTSVLVTTPGATKFYRSAGEPAMQKQRLTADNGALLEWFPQENIFFPGANAEISTRIDLAPQAKCMAWEIICLGLPVNGERFTDSRLRSTLAIYRDRVPLLLDRLRVNSERDLDRPAGLRSFPVSATFIATCAATEMLEPVRNLSAPEKDALFAATLMDDLLVARYLGSSTFAARNLFTEIWSFLRPQIAGRKACLPRIWAT
ncbi:MAG: urease accessory protein UreD [Desulfobulbaceae bacterium]|nr:urease accessory protein UreD [Desulfobulbaceae bacterium]